MGVELSSIAPAKEITFEFLKGRIVGIDAYNTLYQFLATIRGRDGMPLMDSKGRITSHLTGLLYRTTTLIEREIKPVFVFDGEPSKLKKKTLEKRAEAREEAKEAAVKAREEGRVDEARKYAQRAVKLTPELVEEAKTLLTYMGLPIVQAPSEGEAQLAVMNAKGDIYGCVSQDYDTLLFGAQRVIRNLTISGKKKAAQKDFYIEIKPQIIELKELLQNLGIDRKKLIWIGILVGTDFNEKFPGIGPKRALELVKKYDSFEQITAATNHEPDFDYREVEKLFMNPAHTESYKLEFKPPEREKIVEFLCEERDFSVERVTKAVKKLEERASSKGVQSRLSMWQ
jgi:flap endonuclease-1